MNLAQLFILVILSGSILGCEGIDFSNKGCPEKTFGKWCHKCNCKIDCNRENGTCGSQCLEGWQGPNCQMQNIAKNKPTKVREYENSFGQSTVNGDRTDCSFLVNHDKKTMRLRAELEETYNIHGITIFTSKDRTILEKMEGFEVVLSRNDSIKAGNVCYDNTQSGKISDSGKIDTSCHGKAKNVFLYHGKKPSYLNICEIEVYVCRTGFWGEQCEYPCECTGSKDQTCDSKTGKCPGGCSTDGGCPQVGGMVHGAFYMSVTALVLLAGMFLSWLMYIIIKSLGIRCRAPVRRDHGPYQGRFMEEGHATELTEYEVLDPRQGPKT